jgi:hypothetical protein
MTGFRCVVVMMILAFAGLALLVPSQACAQMPMAVPMLQPAGVPVVTYMPERRGLFGLQTVYRPVITMATPVVAAPKPVVVASPVIQAQPMFQAQPVAPVTMFRAPAPVTTFRVPAPVMAAPAPVTVFSPPVQVFSPVLPVILP